MMSPTFDVLKLPCLAIKLGGVWPVDNVVSSSDEPSCIAVDHRQDREMGLH